jgi:hypothetical protein
MGGMILIRKTEALGEKSTIAPLVHHKSHMEWHEI